MATTWLEKVYEFLFAKSKNEDILAYPYLPLLVSFASVLLLNIAYIVFVLKFGPWLMRNREPFNIKKCLMIYNITQVIVCLFFVLVAIYYFLFTDYFDFGCVLKLPVDHPKKSIEVYVSYVGYLTKYLDYIDTIFFVLRKSFRQVTFLHVYHHLIISMVSYAYIRDYGFGGHVVAGATFNALIHVFMYSYYFATSRRPDLKKSIWWKRYITKLQIVQFLVVIIHQMWPILVRTDCTFPKTWLFITSSQSMIFLYLFGKFYNNTYLNKKNIHQQRNGFEKVKKN